VAAATPDVTIVVVASSVRHELERCFASIAEHARVSTQVILVDNASKDDTREWVRAAHPDLTVVELERNIGVAARQEGLARARGRFTMFLDSDAALTAGALPAMVDALDRNPDWGLVGPRLVYEDGGLQLSARRFPSLALPFLRRPPLARWFEESASVRRHLMSDIGVDRPRSVLYVLGACQIFRTELAHAVGPFDSRIFFGPDDADWCIRIRDAGGDVVYYPGAVVVHAYRRMTSAKPVSGAALKHLKAFYYFQWKYRNRRRALIRLGEDLDRRAAADASGARSRPAAVANR
jgi:GT2 family glycosyltransferase